MNTAKLLALSNSLSAQVGELELKTTGTGVSPSSRRVIEAIAATAREIATEVTTEPTAQPKPMEEKPVTVPTPEVKPVIPPAKPVTPVVPKPH